MPAPNGMCDGGTGPAASASLAPLMMLVSGDGSSITVPTTQQSEVRPTSSPSPVKTPAKVKPIPETQPVFLAPSSRGRSRKLPAKLASLSPKAGEQPPAVSAMFAMSATSSGIKESPTTLGSRGSRKKVGSRMGSRKRSAPPPETDRATVHDLATRARKSEQFASMQVGAEVVICKNRRTGHHDVTDRKAHVQNKRAVVMAETVWPSTWLSVKIIETGEMIKVRTSNVTLATQTRVRYSPPTPETVGNSLVQQESQLGNDDLVFGRVDAAIAMAALAASEEDDRAATLI